MAWNRKQEKDSNEHFTSDDPLMANKHMKTYSTSLISKKMQVTTIIRCYYTPIWMAKIKLMETNGTIIQLPLSIGSN